MKKLLVALLSVLMVLSVAPLTVFAANNGPSEQYEMWDDEKHYYAHIYAQAPDASGEYFGEHGQNVGTMYRIFDDNRLIDNCPGLSYNRQTNELKIDDTNQKLMISANLMGDDFTIRVDGRADIAQITVIGNGYGGNLHIKGNGELTVNKDRRFTTAITLVGLSTEAKMTVGSDVYLDLYAGTGANDKVVETFSSTNAIAKDAYRFENTETITVGQTHFSYEDPVRVKGVYLADPTQERWAGFLADRTAGDDGYYYVVDIRDYGDSTEYGLGRYAYVPQFDAFVRDYDFTRDTEYGYEFVYTEDEWNAQTDYVLREEPSQEPAELIYYMADDLDGDRYGKSQVTRASDPDGFYGFCSYTRSVDDVIEFNGYLINRYVYAPGTDKLIEDASFDGIEITEEDLANSEEWSVVYGTDYVPLEWTGTVVSSKFELYEDADHNSYLTDYEGIVYTFGNEGVVLSDDTYAIMTKVNGVSADSLTIVMNNVVVDDLWNYYISEKHLEYGTPGGEPPAILTGWQTIDGKQFYYDKNGKPVTYRQKIGGKWYYFNGSGVLQKGWIKGGNWFYADKNGVLQTGWQKIGGKWYLFNGSGAMLTGWQKSGGKWYYFNSSGAMLTGWQKLGGKWYLFNSSGAMLTGWQKSGGKWYYFNGSGAMLTGWQKLGGKWYYFNSGGDMVSGWKKIGGSWYYFESSGAMRTASLKQGGKTYYFNASGACTNP